VNMKLAAARAIADLGERSELVPDALDPIVHERVAEAVREAAERSGTARAELASPGL
jgi:malate dehydrogenase (oxaloacetate-decarboxylating)